ncbi:hypothetical protein GOV11_00240, partial [Candidatus Woesearchaeota archaeon]|nr:hypothetical protein [Candidatus Woesearchaeota archaeon]
RLWGGDSLDIYSGLESWGLTFLFLLFFLMLTVLACKLVAVKLGYLISYKPHLSGLIVGLIVTVASNGILPLFLPGGFNFSRPERLAIGKFKSQYKGWEMGVIAGTFPAFMLLFILVLSPMYILTQSIFYVRLMTVVCLTAVYALIPLPNLKSGKKGSEWYKRLRGCTFGLDVFYASGPWYVILSVAVVLFTVMAWLVTSVGSRVGFFIYGLSFLLAMFGWFIHLQFFKNS